MPGPYAELHRHLDGSLRPATVADFARRDGLAVPADLPFHRGMGLPAALSRFGFTLSLLRTPERVAQVAAEMCEDALAEGVTTLEIRFAPQLHTGATMAAIIDAALSGISGRAGLILCGLYGEPPALLEALVELAVGRPGVVGLDLAGGPAPGNTWSLTDYAAPFARAARLGLGRTVHAGEGRPAAEIRTAIEVLGAQRIGHGTTLLGDAEAIARVIDAGVVIEVCLTSNLQTGAIDALEDHGLPRWLARGVRACVCADNTLFSQTNSPTEHALAAALPGMTAAALAQVVATGHAAAFRR